MYTFEQLKEDVRKEAEALRVHATKEERERLDIDNLFVSTKDGCIYGQMTGNCFSYRSAVLIKSCANRYFKEDVMISDEEDREYVTVSSLLKHVNGSEVENFVKERTSLIHAHYSAIEAYILLPEAQNASLISYLRGETETLTL